MPISAQSRLSVHDNPPVAPGTCFLCGSAGDGKRKFIDFAKQIEFYGAVYICTICIVEVSEAADFVPVANFDSLHNSYRELQIKYDQLQAKYAPFEEAIKNVIDSPDPGFGMVLHPSGFLSNNDEVRESDERNTEESSSGEPASDESDNVEGPDDFFDSSDFDND